MLTIVFYTTDGAAAKLRGREIAAQEKGSYARVYDAAMWSGTPDRCDAVEIMPDVPPWQRQRIMEVYGSAEDVAEQPEAPQEDPARIPMGLMPAKEETSTKKAVHKGGGRWFVVNGEERISGPHEKEEALRLANEE